MEIASYAFIPNRLDLLRIEKLLHSNSEEKTKAF